MQWFNLPLFIGVFIALVVIFLIRRRTRADGDEPYELNEQFFSPAERSFLGILDQAVGDDCRVFGKIRVTDVVSVRPLPRRKEWQRAFNRIQAKHFDFLVCSADSLEPLCAVELDDRSHRGRQRRRRDELLEEVCELAGLPLLRIPARHACVVAEVKQLFDELFEIEEPTVATGWQEELATEILFDGCSSVDDDVRLPAGLTYQNEPNCPACAVPMVRRERRDSDHAVAEYWACRDYPRCARTIPIVRRTEPVASTLEGLVP